MAGEVNDPKGETKLDAEAFAKFADTLANVKPVKSKVPEVDWNFTKCPKSQLAFC